MDLTQRIDRPEIMDTQTVPLDAMREALRFLSTTNRYFGGAATIVNRLKEWSQGWHKKRTVRILDVGTGAADIPVAIANWAWSSGFSVEILGIDLVPDVVAIARENVKNFSEISIERRDLFALADAGGKFDYVIASLLLHHIAPGETDRVLQTFDRVATRGIIVSDLFRSAPSYWAVKSLSRLIGNAIVRHDGPLSVRRAFTVDELNSAARNAGINYLRGRREPWFRVSLSGEKPSPCVPLPQGERDRG